MRLFTIPKWLRLVYPGAIWEFSSSDPSIYLTFDDGPCPSTTPWLLDLLREYEAKATFFCIGKNIEDHPELVQRIRDEGHRIANHSYSHLKGTETEDTTYIDDILKGAQLSQSKLYRPPYGKIKTSQYRKLRNQHQLQAVFWSVLSYDYDATLPSAERLEKMRKLVKPGKVIVFHDSEKAFPQLQKELPLLLEEWKNRKILFNSIPQ